jgi:hypothetical protein
MIRATAQMAGLPAAPPPTVSVPNAAPETIVVSIWGGPPGPAGEPGAGVALQGVASTWPPSATPAVGDLYVVADPVPAGTPAGIAAGDGVVWNGTEWKSTGPIRGPAGEQGEKGEQGEVGPGSAVFEGPDEPATAIEGDLWLKPDTDPDGNPVRQLNVYTGTDWRPVAGGAGGVSTVNTVGNFGGITEDPALPIQQWSEEMTTKAAFKDTGVGFTRVEVRGAGDIGDASAGDGWMVSTAGYFGTLYYGALGNRAAGDPPGYELPTPTQQGYLRADQDPASGWYFAEPVILSEDEPPAPPGDPNLPTIWAKPVDAAPGGGVTMAQVQAEIDRRLEGLGAVVAAYSPSLMDDMRRAINGGVLPPPDLTTWTKCPIGPAFPSPISSTVEVVQVNGVLYFRGDLTMSAGMGTQNSLAGAAYLELPAGFARPIADVRFVVTGLTNMTATSLTIGTVTLSASGAIRFHISNCETVYVGGLSARVI